MNKAFIIRVDSSYQIGTGHVMRCLTLANQLKLKGHQVEFVCRDLPGNIADQIKQQFPVHLLAFDASKYREENYTNEYAYWLGVDWQQDANETKAMIQERKIDTLIIDHYGLDVKWQKALRSCTQKIMVIDDLANRQHDCDILLDQNYYQDLETRYDKLLPTQCKKLLGPKHALLRPEFKTIRERRLALGKDKMTEVKRILLFMGGTDPGNVTLKVLQNFPGVDAFSGQVDVVVGRNNPHQDEVADFCAQDRRFLYHCQPSDYDELLIQADLAIGAGGGSSWERCCIGLPSIQLVLANNQYQLTQDGEKAGFWISMENGTFLDCKEFLKIVKGVRALSHIVQRLLSTFTLVDKIAEALVHDYV